MSALERLGPPAFADLGDVRLAYWSAGPQTGVPVVFCHGFPELAYSWRNQLAACEAAGRRAIAPDQRGYGLSSRPEGVEAYDMEHLTGDLVRLLDHLGVEKAIFCGHDWGGLAAWRMPLMHPDRVAGVIGLNTPFLPRLAVDPIAAFKARYGPDMYIVFFQEPGAAEALFEADPEKTLRFFFRKYDLTQEQFLALPPERRSLALHKALEMYDPAGDPRQLLGPEDLAVYVEAFTRTGFGPAVNWYRNLTRNWEMSANEPATIGVPCLMITAEHDIVLPPAMAAHMPNLIPDLETHMVEGSGHWTQQERPKEVNRLILDWLDRRFPV
ncbi:MAG: alpha/beta fold hydrolase [Caulobacteraceae bacterium]